MSMRTPLGIVRGLGSAKEGVAHWWAQRLTAVALLPLGMWFIVGLASAASESHAATVEWISSPVSAGLLIFLIVALLYHTALGLQVVFEDYIHGEGLRIACIVAMQLICFALAMIGVVSVISVVLGGSAG